MGHERPFEKIALAEQAWQAGDFSDAEKLFTEGISAYRRAEPDGLDFALGRYGAFLISQHRTDEAARVLEQAIDQETDLPAIWSDYIQIVGDRHDLDAFKRAIERMASSGKNRVETEFILAHARRAHRQGATAFAEDIARWVIDRSVRTADNDGRWSAIGDLGRLLERDGQLEQAMQLWRKAFDEGSSDPETIDRLSMHLEHAKDYQGAIAVIREALQRGLPANSEETLRRRIARCEARVSGSPSTKNGKRDDVPAYSVRQQSPAIQPTFQIRIKPSVRDIAILGSIVRCLLGTRGSSTLIDIDLRTGCELKRIENLPELGETRFTLDGHGIGVHRKAAVGKGPTLLTFLDANGQVLTKTSVPDATSDVTPGGGLWYVGCRNGFLYGFDFDGKQRWKWETPGASGFTDNVYFRPCPYYVASSDSFAVVASMGNIYAVSPNGTTLWHAPLPNERQTRWEFTVPIPGVRTNQDPYRLLELAPGATSDQVKSAYRRLALATHPDRNPADSEATTKFRTVQEAYERILVGDVGHVSEATHGITISMQIAGTGPIASFLVANDAGVTVGSSQGRVYRFDRNGSLREARAIGDGQVKAAVRPDGMIGAAWCSDALVFFHEGKIVNAAEAIGWPNALTMFGNDVVLWRGNEVTLLDHNGRSIWCVEFSKSVANVVGRGDTLLCAAGVLAAFRRSDA